MVKSESGGHLQGKRLPLLVATALALFAYFAWQGSGEKVSVLAKPVGLSSNVGRHSSPIRRGASEDYLDLTAANTDGHEELPGRQELQVKVSKSEDTIPDILDIALSTINGDYSRARKEARNRATVVIESTSAQHFRKRMTLLSEDRVEVDGIESYSWSMDGLFPGDYVITYDGELIQPCSLVPGVNSISADGMGGPTVELLFVNRVSGAPIAVENVQIAAMTSPMEATAACFVNLDAKQNYMNPGEFVSVDSPLGGWILVMVSAPGYGVCFQTVEVYEGAVHAIELSPAVRVEVELTNSDGTEAQGVRPEWSSQIKLISNSIIHSPTISGTRSGTLFAEFSGVSAKAGHWKLVLPSGLSAKVMPSIDLLPGTVLSVEAVNYMDTKR